MVEMSNTFNMMLSSIFDLTGVLRAVCGRQTEIAVLFPDRP